MCSWWDDAHRPLDIRGQRHRIVDDHRVYPHTRVKIEMSAAIARMHEIGAFIQDVRHPRYER